MMVMTLIILYNKQLHICNNCIFNGIIGRTSNALAAAAIKLRGKSTPEKKLRTRGRHSKQAPTYAACAL